jgi:hypothetical protein
LAEPEKNEEPRARPDNREPTADLIEASGHKAASKAGYIAAADPAHAERSRNALAEREASIHPFFAAFNSTWRSILLPVWEELELRE